MHHAQRLIASALVFSLAVPALAQVSSKGTILRSPNAKTPTTPIYSATNAAGQPAGLANGVFLHPTWGINYYGGPDFGNTVPVFTQALIRSTTVSDYNTYEAAFSVDFYSRTGYVAPWARSKAYNVGEKAYVGTSVYRVTTAGTSSASGNGPSGSAQSIPDGTAVWTPDGNMFTNAKQGVAIGCYAFSGAGDTWCVNPNLILGAGFKSKAFAFELNLGNNSGFDAAVGGAIPGPEGFWLGGAYQNTSLGGITIGGFPDTSNPKPMFVFGYWCKNAMAAGDACYMDWSNAKDGFATASFATKTNDFHASATAQIGYLADGAKSTSGFLSNTTGPVAFQNNGAASYGAFVDNSASARGLVLQGQNATGIALLGTFSTAQVAGTGWNVDPLGRLTVAGSTINATTLKATQVLSNGSPFAFWRSTTGTANQKTFVWAPFGSTLYLQNYSDADGFISNLFAVSAATGNVSVTNTLDAGNYSAGGTVGVTCNAPPTANFRVKNGIVTAC